MQFTPELLPALLKTISETIEKNTEEVTALDQALGDGDHVTNLQRGISALTTQAPELSLLNWVEAWQKIGMTLLTTMGGASGSLFGTLFISMSKAGEEQLDLSQQNFSDIFFQGVESVKKRGKSDAGDKTMLDVLIPVSDCIKQGIKDSVTMPELLKSVYEMAIEGMENTCGMLATKGRASYMQEKSIGHIDAGARTSQLIICAIVNELDR